MAIDAAKRDLRLVRGQILPRLPKLLASWVPVSAALFGGALTFLLPQLPAASLPISSAVANGVTFASISMGACVSSLVLSLGLPGTRRLRRWALMKGDTKDKSALSDLIFVLVWAALAQIALLFVCIAAFVFGSDQPLAPQGMLPSHRLGLFIGLTAFFYALFELLVVVQTLSQMGVLIIEEEKNEPAERE